jgi:hypothetical protein
MHITYFKKQIYWYLETNIFLWKWNFKISFLNFHWENLFITKIYLKQLKSDHRVTWLLYKPENNNKSVIKCLYGFKKSNFNVQQGAAYSWNPRKNLRKHPQKPTPLKIKFIRSWRPVYSCRQKIGFFQTFLGKR